MPLSRKLNAEAEIRNLIENWARAVREQDLDGVLARHAEDIVMFDVPPPVQLRGAKAYRESWPPFFDHQNGGSAAAFDIVSLDVTTGDEVAFATAILRCGTREEMNENPEPRLRLTVGLRKESGHWLIAHEHHSFPAGA